MLSTTAGYSEIDALFRVMAVVHIAGSCWAWPDCDQNGSGGQSPGPGEGKK